MPLDIVPKPMFLLITFLAFAISSEPARTAVLDPQYGSEEQSGISQSRNSLPLLSVQAGPTPVGSYLPPIAIPLERLSMPNEFTPDISLLPGPSDPANVGPQTPLLRRPAEPTDGEKGPAGKVRSKLKRRTVRDDIRNDPTVRDILRSYVNVRQSSASPANRRSSGGEAGRSSDDDRKGSGFGVGLGDAILDLSADSPVGQLVRMALEPSTHLDGSVTFSIFGLGSFTADVTRGGSALQVIDLVSGRSVIGMLRSGDAGGDLSRSALPKRRVTISIKEFILSMARELIRTPIFYVIVVAVLGLGVYARTRPN